MTPFDEILRRKRRARTPGFAGGELDEQLARDDLIFDKRKGGYDIYGGLNPRQGERAVDAKRRLDLEAAMIGRRDPSIEGEAMFAPPGEQDTALDYVPQSRFSRLRQHPPLGAQPPRPTGIPLDAHWDATGIGPDGGEWISPSGGRDRVLTPANRTAITRPRTTGAMPDVMTAPPEASRQRAVSFDPVTGRPNETFYRDKDNVAGLYDAYRNWEPRGAKRGFKNSLKSALLMAAEGVRAAPDDPITGALSGLVVGAGAGTASPNFLNRLRRQQRLPQLAAEVGSELDREKTQAQIDAGRMIEVTLDNGQTVMVPAKTAGTLQSRQQEIDLRGNTLEARKKRWSQLNEHEAARDAQALYNSGAADDSAELRAEIARRLRLPPDIVLPPRGLGNQIKVDELGNYVVISPRSGEVTDTGRGSFSKTQEAGREIRSRRATQAANERTRYIQGQINQRQANRPAGGVRPDTVTGRKAATLIGKIEQRRRTMVRADELLKANPDDAEARAMREKAQAEGEGFAAELNALGAGYEAGPGVLGYPYYKRGGVQQSSGRYAGKRFPAANLPEAAKRLGVSVDEARRLLESEGAVIYE